MGDSEIIKKREKQIQEICQVIDKCENQLDNLLKELDWSKEKLPKLKLSNEIGSVDEKRDATACISEKRENIVGLKDESFDLNAISELCSTIDKKKSSSIRNIDINKLKRDLKRRRMKYRTTKVAPLTYTEELRELINLQMELVQENKSE